MKDEGGNRSSLLPSPSSFQQPCDLRQRILEVALQCRDSLPKLGLFGLGIGQRPPQARDLMAGLPQRDERRTVEAQAVEVKGAHLGERHDVAIRLLAEVLRQVVTFGVEEATGGRRRVDLGPEVALEAVAGGAAGDQVVEVV